MQNVSAPEPKDGLYPRMPFAQYASIARVNQSFLGCFSLTAAHAREYLIRPQEPSDDMKLGTWTHMAILEPEVFLKQCVVAPQCDRRRAEGKAIWEAFQRDNPGKEILARDDYDACKAMLESVRAHPLAQELIRSRGTNEISALWTDPETGIACKGRIDRLCSLYGYTILLDVKTTRSAAVDAFSKSIAQFGYHRQAAFYLDGLNALARAERRFWILAVEKTPPYCVQLFEMTSEAIQVGREEYRCFLARYQQCLKTKNWPGYDAGVTPIGLPRWYRSNVGNYQEAENAE